MNSRDLPEVRSSFWEIKDLPRIEQALEFVQESRTLISSTFRIDENDYGLKILRRNWLDYKCLLCSSRLSRFLTEDRRFFLIDDLNEPFKTNESLHVRWLHTDPMNLHHSHLLIICLNNIRLEWILK